MTDILLELVPGDDWDEEITIADENGDALDLTGWTVVSAAISFRGGSIALDTSTADAASGKLRLTKARAGTGTLPIGNVSTLKIVLRSSTDFQETLVYGRVNGVRTKSGNDATVRTPGIQGLSAYEVAVRNGFAGTEEEWLESLEGVDNWDDIQGKPTEFAPAPHTHEIDDVIGLESAVFSKPSKPVFPLDIPTFDGNPSVTHPDVLYVPEGFHGYSFWMSCTPFPDDFREFPEIFASNDGTHWERPDGVPAPLISQAGFEEALGPDFYYNADPDLVMLPDRRLALYMRPVGVSGALKKEWLVRVTSEDGHNWSALEILAETQFGDPIVWRSPAVVVEPDGSLSMWTTSDWLGVERSILRRTSADGLVWSAPQLCSAAGNLRVWHLDVVRTPDGMYHMLGQANSGSDLLYYWKSVDGLIWTPGCGQAGFQSIPLIPGVDKTSRYRSTFQPVSGDPYRFHIWLTTVDESGPGKIHRIAAFLPNYQLGGFSTVNLIGSYYLHYGNRFSGSAGADYGSVFLGITAGQGNSGLQQVAVGYDAGLNNAKLYQTAMGSRAGRQNSGDYQTAVGRQAGELNTAIQQVAIGNQAGVGNTGLNQTAIGYQAGSGNTGPRQTAIGSRSGINNTAANTTSIGELSLASHTGSVALGYNTQTTQTNQVALGDRDVELQGNGKGIYLRSPDGTRYKLTVANGGSITVTPA